MLCSLVPLVCLSPTRTWSRVLIAAAATLGAVGAPSVAPAQAPTFTWQTSTPDAQGVKAAPLDTMVTRIRQEGLRVDSFLLVKNGYIVREEYFGSYTRDTRHILYSVSKSFTAACFGIARDEGLIGSLDQKVLDVFSDRAAANVNDYKRAMTLRHLLIMSNGHALETANLLTGQDWVKTFLDAPCTFEPGTRFYYDSGGAMMLSAMVQQKTGANLLAYAATHLFAPLEITQYSWEAGPNNLTAGGWGLSLTSRDMAKFGLLYLHHGAWLGRQIVPASWVAESSRRQISNGTSGPWGSGYGYQFWLNDFGGYRADGYGGQFIFILPHANAIAVFTSSYTNGAPTMELMSSYVVPALATGDELPGISLADSLPVVHLAPAAAVVSPGDEADFQVEATGGSLSYEWTRNGEPLPGATSATLRIPAATSADLGSYSVRITNGYGTVETTPVSLTFSARDEAARLVNLSARARAGAGDATLIIGLVTAGPEANAGLPCLIRGIGPSLAEHGVSAPLADPSAVLFDGSRPIRANADWHGSALLTDRGARVGAMTLSGASRDAALLAMLRPGSYTLHVTANSGTGIALGECYEATPDPAAGGPRLINLSARARVEPGEGALIAGFIIRGVGHKQVLIRAVGPSLAQYAVSGYLADPVLTLFNEAGAVIASNDTWGGTAELRERSAALGGFPLPDNSPEAMLLVSLPAGAYTAQVTGKDGATGVALVELYSQE